MAILVLGNGFDLAHDLPTSYASFLVFIGLLWKYPVDSDESIRRLIDSFKADNPRSFEEVLGILNKRNGLLYHFLSVYRERLQQGKAGWIDFEIEISELVRCFEKIRKLEDEAISKGLDRIMVDKHILGKIAPFCCKDYKWDNNSLSRKFNVGFFDSIESFFLDNLNDLTRLLEIYLVECVERIEVTKKIPEIDRLKDITHVLSFNYTDTYQRVYNESVHSCFIHGKAKSDSSVEGCNLVLGIDEYLKDERKDNNNRYVWFKKFYQRIYKETSSEYIDWLDEHTNTSKMMPNPLELYFFGHSFDVTDRDILNKLITHENSITNIFYKDKADMAIKISNLVKIIGEDELIEMTRGKNRSIRFLPLENLN